MNMRVNRLLACSLLLFAAGGCSADSHVLVMERPGHPEGETDRLARAVGEIVDGWVRGEDFFGPQVELSVLTDEGERHEWVGRVFRARRLRVSADNLGETAGSARFLYRLAVARTPKQIFGRTTFFYCYSVTNEDREAVVETGLVVTTSPKIVAEKQLWEGDLQTVIRSVARDLLEGNPRVERIGEASLATIQ